MSDSRLTLARVFPLPPKETQGDSSDGWQEFQENVATQVKSIKWSVSMPDLVSSIAELFDVEIPDILTVSWKKADALKKVLAESKASPDETFELELAEHTIESEHHPYIEIRIRDIPVPKTIEFTVLLSFTLKGFILKIQDGEIREIRTGSCDVEGSVQFQGVTIVEKKSAPIQLPGSIPVHEAA